MTRPRGHDADRAPRQAGTSEAATGPSAAQARTAAPGSAAAAERPDGGRPARADPACRTPTEFGAASPAAPRTAPALPAAPRLARRRLLAAGGLSAGALLLGVRPAVARGIRQGAPPIGEFAETVVWAPG
jgi:hypothetical protein